MLPVDRYAYQSRLRTVHPAAKLLFAAAALLICLASSTPVTPVLVTVVMGGSVVLWSGIPWLCYLRLLAPATGFLLAGLPAVALSLGEQSADLLWRVNVGSLVLGVSRSGLWHALLLAFKCLGSISCLYFLALTTPTTEILFVLRRLGVPGLFVELMSLTYRYLFVLLETAVRIYVSQAARGGYVSYLGSLRSVGVLLAVLFVRAHQKALAVFTTISARGYTGTLGVVGIEYRLSWKNTVAMLGLALGFLVSLLLSGGGGHVRAYP